MLEVTRLVHKATVARPYGLAFMAPASGWHLRSRDNRSQRSETGKGPLKWEERKARTDQSSLVGVYQR